MVINYEDMTRGIKCLNCGRFFKIPVDTPLDEVPDYCQECPPIEEDEEF